MKEVAVGIDIGGTNSVYGFVDKNGNVLAKNTIPTQGFDSIEDYVKKLHESIQETFQNLKTINKAIEIYGIGIGAPNGNYYKGTIEHAPNLDWKGVVPLVDLFKKYYSIPVALTNDANAAAIGEMIYGGAKNMKNFIVLTLGTGLGSGIIINGNLVYGHTGFAGELGHVVIFPEGRECGCSRRGCLETYVSATGIKRTVQELLAKYRVESTLSDISFKKLTSKMITEAAMNGDKIALEAFEYTAKILARGMADMITFSSPEAIFLFGGLALAGDYLFKPTQKYLDEYVMKIFKSTCKIQPSLIPESNAAVLGASAIVWKEVANK
ncbi:MAG: glucokinase [Bacteroidia bacterium]|nr:MAG: glucokinase [Bacteroidia bacterium]